ncbi:MULTISPECIES: tyrosine-type recombinase/integrase [Gordonia]|uniref:Integrase/recombinase n=1 Tax=Gordonia rubripertincta NBRC 101908 TaxID=1077975 RepID=A0ABQ0HPI5_GORRU|nr:MULTISPECIES: site-specific integrase [Gordonia]GAB84190.1 putative integrase/recombinase [Gordonia rubripertincta NBRC 101908]ATD73086.1 integrase [Gordonia sp. 1D]KAF0967120.1 Tyrosine recombinase XerC [Gordonia sp. YY1]MCZ4654102.1 tyrosine-type recombinase/integrase [Gordonia amicalis]MDJ0453219.1 tyrosine-type recombinase/integrase [Gordonia amicalis]
MNREDAKGVPTRLPAWGRVNPVDGVPFWSLVGPDDREIEPVGEFLKELVTRGHRAGTVRSYAYDLLRWWRWLRVIDRPWNRATQEDLREFVLWLSDAIKPESGRRTVSVSTAGTINAVTRKQYLDDRYKPRTIRHSNAVLRTFYEWAIIEGTGPLVNPVQLRNASRRAHAHHNPLESFRTDGRLRYNPPIPKRRPRVLPDPEWVRLFGALTSNRDRALLSMAVSNGARAGEILGMRMADVDWGEQLVRVTRKGSRDEQWLPVSAEALLWLRLYLSEIDDVQPNAPLWWTLRVRNRRAGASRQPMNYETLRGVFRRTNVALGTNWSMHDLRHTAARRMADDSKLSLRDVQTILGHRQIATTVQVYLHESDVQVASRVLEHLSRPSPPHPLAGKSLGYRDHDMSVLFGGEDLC